jgi:hypothetical protein
MNPKGIRRLDDDEIRRIHEMAIHSLETGITDRYNQMAMADYTRSIAASNLIIIELMIRVEENR